MASLLTLNSSQHRLARLGILLGCIASIIHPGSVYAQSAAMHPFLSPSAIATHQTLKVPAQLVSPTSLLQLMVEQVSIEHKVPIWIDRRVVRDRLIRVQAEGSTIGQLLKEAANQVDATLLPMDGVIAVVPLASFDAYASAYWELSEMFARTSGGNQKSIRFEWSEGADAPEVFRRFSEKAGIKVSKENVPWDVWRAFDFQGASLASVSVCLLGGFDLVLVNENKEWKVTSLRERYSDGQNNFKQFAWTYSASDVDRIPVSHRESWRKRWPKADVSKIAKPSGSKVLASAACHLELIEPLVPTPKSAPKPKAIELSGTIQGTVGGLLTSLAKTYQLKFDVNSLPGKSAQRELSIKVERVSLEELIRRIGKEVDIQVTLDGNEIRAFELK